MRNIAAALAVVVFFFAALALTGCAEVAGHVPSFQYCPNVKYERIGNQAHIEADCALPIGGSAGVLPLPASALPMP